MAKESDDPIEPETGIGRPPPLRWIAISNYGGGAYQVRMVRLIRFDVEKIYSQLAPPGPVDQIVIRRISRDIEALRDLLDTKVFIQQITMDVDGISFWISIPSVDNKFFKTKKSIWNTIIRRWPQFLDEEWTKSQR